MAKRIAIVGLLCLALCLSGVSAFATGDSGKTYNQGSGEPRAEVPATAKAEAPAEPKAEIPTEPQSSLSSVIFTQNGTEIQQSIDGGKTWESYSPIEEPEYFTYDEFAAWIENEAENIQKLVDAGEWTEEEAAEVLAYYAEILERISDGVMVSKRPTLNDDQLFFSMPNTVRPEQYQTFVFDGSSYTSIGPFDTEEELFNALKGYTDTAVAEGTMTPEEAASLLVKYQ